MGVIGKTDEKKVGSGHVAIRCGGVGSRDLRYRLPDSTSIERKGECFVQKTVIECVRVLLLDLPLVLAIAHVLLWDCCCR